MAFEKIIDVTRLNRFKTKILELVYQKGDVYTKNEVDNKFSALETNIDWKEAVATYNDIATTYPNPVDGWTVNVKDTDYTYRYNGTSWVAISANAIPKATQSVDGLITKEDKTKLDGVATGAQTNVIETVKVNGSTLTPTSKAVDIIVPTNVSDLSDSDNYLKTDGDSKSNTITFTSSDVADGSATSWTSNVPALTSGLTHTTLFERVSQMFKNVRYLYKMLGTTNISGIGNGTVTGALDTLNSNLGNKQSSLSRSGKMFSNVNISTKSNNGAYYTTLGDLADIIGSGKRLFGMFMMDFSNCNGVITPYCDNSKVYVMSTSAQSNITITILFVYA